MLKYITQMQDLDKIMGVLYRILDIRITFFDMRGYEQDTFNIKEMSQFCTKFRQDKENDRKCISCDLQHLKFAKEAKTNHIYHCHQGLLEGIIPLYDRHDVYIGAIVFGQLRDSNIDIQTDDKKEKELYFQLKILSVKEMEDIALLLKLVSEYIIENEIIKYKNKPWVEVIEEYIKNHLDRKIEIKELAELINRSTSFLSHNFFKEFGMSPKQYILKGKMNKAKEMLANGESVKITGLELGFYDEFHFSKAFKTYWKDSPKNFKL